MATSYISQWESTDASSLTRESILNLLDGKVPFIRQSNFIPREIAQKLEDELCPKLSPYLHATGPTLQKVGVAQFEYQAQSERDLQVRADNRIYRKKNFLYSWRNAEVSLEKERYFAEVEKHKNLHEDLAKLVGCNVWNLVVNKLKSLLPDWDVIIAEEEAGKKYFSGIYRAINNSTPIHCDWSPYDNRTEDWIINQVTKQAVFNLFLTPIRGGRTEVHDVQWTPDALSFRDPESYGYAPEIVTGRKKAVIEPIVADLHLFNSRNMHQVFPIERELGVDSEGNSGEGATSERLTLSSFMGFISSSAPSGRPRLILWS